MFKRKGDLQRFMTVRDGLDRLCMIEEEKMPSHVMALD